MSDYTSARVEKKRGQSEIMKNSLLKATPIFEAALAEF